VLSTQAEAPAPGDVSGGEALPQQVQLEGEAEDRVTTIDWERYIGSKHIPRAGRKAKAQPEAQRRLPTGVNTIGDIARPDATDVPERSGAEVDTSTTGPWKENPVLDDEFRQASTRIAILDE